MKALDEIRNGSILCGCSTTSNTNTGVGKSVTALAYYYKCCDGDIYKDGSLGSIRAPIDLYIITTAKKRDDEDWTDELKHFNLNMGTKGNPGGITITVDSWNNIHKYIDVHSAFFIFDEQRVTGRGPWAKSFIRIGRRNKWILLSSTPGDSWSDYIPVFIANGFYKHRTEFNRKHVIFNTHVTYPKIEGYVNENELIKHRDDILVYMLYDKHTIQHHKTAVCEYDPTLYRIVRSRRWNPFDNEPIDDISKMFYLLRKVVNSDISRIEQLDYILQKHPKAIIFYNFTYELEMLRKYCHDRKLIFAECNGEKHESVPEADEWVYLVQYASGAEGWNCITTDTMIFFSLNYSYKMMVQAEGRIDRLNTPYTDLYYYHLRSTSEIDKAIMKTLSQKEDFNEAKYLKG